MQQQNLQLQKQLQQQAEDLRSLSVLEQMQTADSDYQLLLTPMFSAMTKITDNLFLTGVGGMTRENFRKNHIDFVVNITTEAPFWEDIESMRLPLEDDVETNIMPYMDTAVDRINEAITQRDAHVLVHCVAGVSRSATIVIAYLMKYKHMDLHAAFNYCYNLRPVIRPNNGFMQQLINYEQQLFARNSVQMVDADVDGTIIRVPRFFIDEHPRLVLLEVMRVQEQQRSLSKSTSSKTVVSSHRPAPSAAAAIQQPLDISSPSAVSSVLTTASGSSALSHVGPMKPTSRLTATSAKIAHTATQTTGASQTNGTGGGHKQAAGHRASRAKSTNAKTSKSHLKVVKGLPGAQAPPEDARNRRQ